MRDQTLQILKNQGIHPSPQRVAVAEAVLYTDRHPSAEEVWEEAKKVLPMVSRATVYNTLNLLVGKGLLRQLDIAEGKVVFDPELLPHHHFVDEESGRIYDVPWDALSVNRVESLEGYKVREYQVILRGRRAT